MATTTIIKTTLITKTTTTTKKKKSRLKITFSGSKKAKLKSQSQRESSVLSNMSISSNSTTASTTKPALSTLMTPKKMKITRPTIERTVQFGDHYLKQQRALNSYYKFKRTSSGKFFENEDLLRTHYGIPASEMIQNQTYSHRFIPYAFEKNHFINLPEQYGAFSTKLFEIAGRERPNFRHTEQNKIKLRFCQYTKQYNDEYYVLNPDYSHRQNHPEIDADFDGAKWMRMWYDFKDECIKKKFFKLFQPFDPANTSSEVAFPAMKLWRKEQPITFHQIEQKLHGAMYTSNESVKRDVQIAFDNLQDIYHDLENYRCFIDNLRQKWILHKTDRVDVSNEEDINNQVDRQKLAEKYSEFETTEECIAYYFDQKTEEQKEKKYALKLAKIIEDRIVTTRLDGDVKFFLVEYKDYPNDFVWEPQLFMLKYYRQETRAYIKNKKKSHLGILLTAPNGIEGQRAFYRMEAGYIPRENEQFGPAQDISIELRQKINGIAAKKAKRLRMQQFNQKNDCDSKEMERKEEKQQCDDENANVCPLTVRN